MRSYTLRSRERRKNQIFQSRYLILGGAGLVGGAFARAMAAQGAHVVAVDLPGKLQQTKISDGITHIGIDILLPGVLGKLLQDHQPDVVLNTLNLATIFSINQGEGYHRLVSFYTQLFETLAHHQQPLHYIQVGTTGSGGLGFNIPFTHGEGLEQRPIIHKAAFSGITSQLLVMLSRSFPKGNIKVSELKPGLAIFDDTFHEEQIAGASCITLDGGESGHYTYNELALLMKMMGFTTTSAITEKIIGFLNQDTMFKRVNSFDVTHAMNAAIITENKVDTAKRKKILAELKRRQEKYNVIATGNLGPRSVTAALVQAYMRLHGVTIHDPDPTVRATLAYLAKRDIALAEYVEVACSKLPPITPEKGVTEPWQIVEM